MKLRVAGLAVATMLSCVPASDPDPPAGAAGFRTAPSPASRGAPFVTDDGWTVQFGDVVVHAAVTASAVGLRDGRWYESGQFLWHARDVVVVYAPGINVGPTDVSMSPSSFTRSLDRTQNLGVDAKTAERFTRPSDDVISPFAGVSNYTPAIIFSVRGERDGRLIEAALALSSSSYQMREARVEVEADNLVTAPLAIVLENLFDLGQTGRREFAPLANADANNDGLVTIDELRATVPPGRQPFGLQTSLLEQLRQRIGDIFVVEP